MQASQEREREELVSALQREHTEKVEGLVRELEQVSAQQARQLRDITQLKDQARTAWQKRERELTNKHERELRAVEDDKRAQIEKACVETRNEMEKKVECIRERHRAELEAMQILLRKEKEKKEVADIHRWEERERALTEQLQLKEKSLSERVSMLSEEARTAKDQLAVARQTVTRMSRQLEKAEGEVGELKGQLKVGHKKREGLEEQLASLQASMEAMKEEESLLRELLSEKEGKILYNIIHVGLLYYTCMT